MAQQKNGEDQISDKAKSSKNQACSGYPNTPVSSGEMERRRKGKAVMTEDNNDEPAFGIYQDLMEEASNYWPGRKTTKITI